METKRYEEIAQVIGSLYSGCDYYPYYGAYYHDTDGNVVATDGRRILVIHDEEKIESPIYMDKKGKVVTDKTYPNYKMHLEGKREVTWSGEFDLIGLVDERKWMSKGDENVIFKLVSKVGITTLGMFSTTFLADFKRCYYAYYRKRPKSLMVKMTFSKDGDLLSVPLRIETLDGKMTYLVMPKCIDMYYHPNCYDKEVIIEKKSVF